MPSFNIRAKITGTELNKFAKDLERDTFRILIGNLQAATAGIQRDVRRHFNVALVSNKTWRSLETGNLKAEFGFTDEFAGQALLDIQKRLLTSIFVKGIFPRSRNFKTQFKAFYNIRFGKGDFSEILSSPFASYQSTQVSTFIGKGALFNRTKNADNPLTRDVDWLEWLLFTKGQTVVDDYYVVFGTYDKRFSRSGKAIMRPLSRVFRKKRFQAFPDRAPKAYSVSPTFAGTREDNFVTEVIQTIEPFLGKIVEKNIDNRVTQAGRELAIAGEIKKGFESEVFLEGVEGVFDDPSEVFADVRQAFDDLKEIQQANELPTNLTTNIGTGGGRRVIRRSRKED
jgi:hypothetical protein